VEHGGTPAEKTTQSNPKNKNAPMLANLFIFAAKSIGH